MFRARGDNTTPPELAEEPVAVVRPEKKATFEAECFKPSTFATRKAAADARNAGLAERRLVSLGESDFPLYDKAGEVELVRVELFYDRDRPSKKYASFPGHGGLMPLQADSGGEDKVVRHPPLKGGRMGRPNFSAYPDPLPEPPPRPA